jgi:hypothetical protein
MKQKVNFCIERKKRRKVLLFRDFEQKNYSILSHTPKLPL